MPLLFSDWICVMTDKSVWFVTGAGRGMGVDIVRAALAAGHAVVATGRNTDAVTSALGEADDLLVVKLDVNPPGGCCRRGKRGSDNAIFG
jgi:NAD(P)-dependent dehydrogenase (short-subunit alcohol dehydrogenase family)